MEEMENGDVDEREKGYVDKRFNWDMEDERGGSMIAREK